MNFLKRAAIIPAAALLFFACKNNNSDAPGPGDNDTTIPQAGFNWTGTQRVDADIQFENTSKNADSYKWDFGNGQTSTKQTPDKIKYTEAGVYDVLLTAIKGNRRNVYKQMLAIAANNQPVAHFSYTYKDQNTAAPAVVEFRDESANAATYRWLIKDVASTDKNATVTFTQAGTYPVSLTVSNAQGESTFTDTVTITPNSNPLAGFSLAFHPFPYTVNEAIQLVNTSKNSDAWEWTFGTNGPVPSSEQHPEVKFAAAGTYTIKLIAKKGNLVSTPRSINLKINP